MDASCTGGRSRFKSPLRVVAWFLERSRETKAARCRKLRQELNQTNRELARYKAQAERDRKEIRELKQQVRRLETEKRIQAQSTSPLPDDPPVNGHGFGPRMVCLATELARSNFPSYGLATVPGAISALTHCILGSIAAGLCRLRPLAVEANGNSPTG